MEPPLQIQLVPVEFLRPGPPHNQLLSPLTQYLAVCGNTGAGVVNVPYEHGRFERRLRQLRYESGDPEDRQEFLEEIGSEIGRMLGSVPGLSGALSADTGRTGAMVHLRVTLSASELALLPFELAKVPAGPGVSAENWLAIQARPPVCVTRHVRTVSPERVVWPDTPRILFICGDPHAVPYREHLDALLRAIAPFRYPPLPEGDAAGQPEGDIPARQEFGQLLTLLVDPTLPEVLAECQAVHYTHVHILTHGDVEEGVRERYGLVLRGPEDTPDVVSGERFASALIKAGVDLPTVVTIASCDSGNLGSVVVPGASVAHALHQAGVPFVVASQFPLSIEGSVPLASTLYRGLLWGEHPLVLVQRLRTELHVRYTSTWHDWASVVVYEALPVAFDEQLDNLRYWQARRAANAALERLDRAVKPEARASLPRWLTRIDAAIEDALARLPLDGQYGVECVGLRASARKRQAQACDAAERAGDIAGALTHDSYDLLEDALRDYERAFRQYLVNDTRTHQRIATLHWVLVQYASLCAILGRKPTGGAWSSARLAAEVYVDHPSLEERGWAHGSLAELWLVRLADPELPPDGRREAREEALHHARKIVRAFPGRDSFVVSSTCRQFQRYVDWWGTDRFAEGLAARGGARRGSWNGDLGITPLAREIVAVLERPRRPRPGGSGTPSVAPGGGEASDAPSREVPAPAPSEGAGGDPGGARPTPGPPTVPASPGLRQTGQASGSVTTGPPRPRSGPFFTIELLPAGHGDCLWIEYGEGRDTHRWLVDCGTQGTSRALMRRVDTVPEHDRMLELFILSHIDSDHIGGALPFFKAVQAGLRFGEVWFNGWRQLSGKLGARQGEMFSTAIQDFGLPWNTWRGGRAIVVDAGDPPEYVLPGGMKITLLSPGPTQLRKLAPVWTREMKRYGLEPGSRVDYRRFLKGAPSSSTDVPALADEPFTGDAGVPNGTSIAVLAEFGGTSVLLGADAHAPVLVESLRALLRKRGLDRLPLGAFKVSHHGSQNNVSIELLQLLDCPRYLLSSNGDHFCHPDRQAVARIIRDGGTRPSLLFNYRTTFNEVWAREDLQERYGYTTHYPAEGASGLTVPLLAE